MKTIFALAYHFSWCVFLCLVFLFAMITNTIGVSRYGNPWRFSRWCVCLAFVVPSLSRFGWVSSLTNLTDGSFCVSSDMAPQRVTPPPPPQGDGQWWRIILFSFKVMNMVKLFKKAFWKFLLDIKIASYLDVKVHFSSSWKEEESWIQVITHTDSTTLKKQNERRNNKNGKHRR